MKAIQIIVLQYNVVKYFLQNIQNNIDIVPSFFKANRFLFKTSIQKLYTASLFQDVNAIFYGNKCFFFSENKGRYIHSR